MAELFAVALVGLAVLVALATAVLAIVALMRTGERGPLGRRLRELEGRLTSLEARGEVEEAAPEPEPKREPVPVPRRVVPPGPVVKPAPAPVPRRARRPSPLRRIDWERWAGVRGAAALGGIILGLAAIYLFKHAFENQWIGPAARCWTGAVLGGLCLAGGHAMRRKGIRFAPEAIEGAGLVALYASVWAAFRLYHFLSLLAAFPLLALVTALACWLALRHRSLLTAVLGLVGGFTAAWMLHADADRPVGLFGYILLLDLGLIFVGQRRGWPLLGFLALLGTFLFESLWVFGSMDAERMTLGLAILGVFAVFFAVTGLRAPPEQRVLWIPSQAGAVLFPFLFALYFAGKAELGAHLYPTASFLALLGASSLFIARTQGTRWLPAGAAAACASVVAVWIRSVDTTTAVVWELAGVVAGLALVFHGCAEWEERRVRAAEEDFGARAAATIAAAVLLAIVALSAAAEVDVPLWPWLAGLVSLGLLLARQSGFAGRAPLSLLAAAGLGLGSCLYGANHLGHHGWDLPDPLLLFAILIALAGGFLALGLARRGTPAARAALHGVGVFVVLALVGLGDSKDYVLAHGPWLALGATLALGLLMASAATALSSWRWFATAAALTALVHDGFIDLYVGTGPGPSALLLAFALVLLAGAAFVAWPAGFAGRAQLPRGLWIIAALAALAWYPVLFELYELRFGDDLPLVVPLLAGIPPLFVWLLGPARRWHAAVALFFFSFAVPLQLDTQWPAVGTALWACALAALARSSGSRPIARVAAAAGLVATLLLVVAALEGRHYVHEEARLFNWISYAHVLPAAALLGAAFLLRRPAGAPEQRRSVLTESAAAGLGGIVVLFLWINLLILNHTTPTGSYLTFALERVPDRDLAMSIAWVLYALVLLGFGVGLAQSGLRWTSLALLLLTIAKVFLHDVGELEGLHRVASMAGLAISLLAVSLLYQRFVFRDTSRAAEET